MLWAQVRLQPTRRDAVTLSNSACVCYLRPQTHFLIYFATEHVPASDSNRAKILECLSTITQAQCKKKG